MLQIKSIFLILLCVPMVLQHDFYLDGTCPEIEGVGSPVLMVAHTHEHVNRAFDFKNPHTHVKMIFSNTPELQSNGEFIYNHVYSVNYNGKTTYYGIQFTAGSGFNMTLFKFIVTDKLSIVGDALSVLDLANKLDEINCGDLKFIFSSYGTDPTADLPYAFPNNRNSIGISLLNSLSNTKLNNNKECINKNYTIYEWLSQSMTTHTTLVHCIPIGIPIHSIRLGCYDSNTDQPVQASDDSHIEYIQLIYNNSDGTTTASEEVKTSAFTLGDEVVIPVDTGAFITFNAYGNETAEIVLKMKILILLPHGTVGKILFLLQLLNRLKLIQLRTFLDLIM